MSSDATTAKTLSQEMHTMVYGRIMESDPAVAQYLSWCGTDFNNFRPVLEVIDLVTWECKYNTTLKATDGSQT